MFRARDDDQRLNYSLAATFLSRMCLSGEIDRLSDAQWLRVQAGMNLYRLVAPIIRDGKSRKQGSVGESWRHPKGWQALVRTAADGKTALVVIHGFGHPPAEIQVRLPGQDWIVDATLSGVMPRLVDGSITLTQVRAFTGDVVFLRKASMG